ncbi:MAG: hypothetical protein ACRDN9_14325 [Streptosporangiaceae bacterium]
MSLGHVDDDLDRIGPYEYRDSAAADCRIVRVLTERGDTTLGQAGRDRIVAEANRAGVKLGAYDLEILGLLAGVGPEAAQVILGLIARTRAAALDAEDDGEDET